METHLTNIEPIRGSVYDVLTHNLYLAKRRTFIHRYIYVGEHKDEVEVEKAFKLIVKAVNDDYCEERITGLLLLYPKYFIHVLDSCESAYGCHFRLLLGKFDNLFGEMKLLGCYHHINQRFFDEWGVRKAKPPILLEKIDPASDFEELKRQLTICITKIYNLCIELRVYDSTHEEPTKLGNLSLYMNQFLPEYTLLNYLLNQNELFSIRLISDVEPMVLDSTYNMQYVWPVRNDYVPYNVFETEKNPIPNLPNAQPK